MKSVWVLGAGKFGRRAVHILQTLPATPKIILVDRDRAALAPCESERVQIRSADVIDYLARHFTQPEEPDWIVPAAPVHVAFEWIKSTLPGNAAITKLAIPPALLADLPGTPATEKGKLYLSLADFICPDDCCEPARYCTVTGKPRPYDLFEKLSQLQIDDFVSVVVRSRQLAPGLGGYRPADLFKAREQVQSANSPILLSTACRCHGVLDAFRLART